MARSARTCGRPAGRLLLALAFCLLGWGASAAPRTVRVGLFSAAPLVFEEGGRATGLFIELAEHFARALDWRIEYRRGEWSELLAALERGEIDLLPAVGYTEERRAVYDFSRHPVYIDSGVVFTGRRFTPHTVFDLRDKRVAALRGSVFTAGFERYMAGFGIACEIVPTGTNREVMELLAAGKVDAGVSIYSLGKELAKDYPVQVTPISFSPVALLFAAPRGREEGLIEAIDGLMAEMAPDPNSAYARIFRKWTEPPVPTVLPPWFYWGSAGVLLLGALLLAWNILLKRLVARQTLHLRGEIAERGRAEEELRRSLEEKEVLLRELYHRTKNTLQVVQSLIILKAGEHPEDEGVQDLVQGASEKIRAIALVHQMLYQSRDLSRVSARAYLTELASSILGGYEGAASRVALELEVEDRPLALDEAVPLGLILNELMTNSLKYAFPGERSGRISLAYRGGREEGGYLRYADDGVGPPEGFDFRAQETLGLRLVLTIGEEQLGGRVSFSGGPGFSCAIALGGP